MPGECTPEDDPFTEEELLDAIDAEYGVGKSLFKDASLDDLNSFYNDPIYYFEHLGKVEKEDFVIALKDYCRENFNCTFKFNTNVKWEKFFDVLAIIDLVKISGTTIFLGSLTVTFAGAVFLACVDPLTCADAIIIMAPNVGLAAFATGLLANGSYLYFIKEYTETDLRL